MVLKETNGQEHELTFDSSTSVLDVSGEGQMVRRANLDEYKDEIDVWVTDGGLISCVYAPSVYNPINFEHKPTYHGRVVSGSIVLSKQVHHMFDNWRSIRDSVNWWHGLFYPCMGIGLGLLLMGISKALGGS
jgi:hypothetical protein